MQLLVQYEIYEPLYNNWWQSLSTKQAAELESAVNSAYVT